MWLHSVARRAARSTSATTRSPSCSSPCVGSSTSTWSSPIRSTSVTRRGAVARLAADLAAVVHLAAAGGVERRLDELGEHLAVLLGDRADRRRLLDGLVAGELGVEARGAGERLRALAFLVATAAAGARAGARALVFHQVLEARRVDPEALLGGELEREVEREAVGVVELEGLGRADALVARRLRARDVLLEDAGALLERLAERLLLAREPHVDGVGMLDQLGVARSPCSSRTTPAKRGRKPGSIPIRRPWRIARRMIRRRT